MMNVGLLQVRLAKLRVVLPDRGFRKALRAGVFAAVEHRAVLATLPPMATVVDVGAHSGQFALVARRAFPDAKIVSFEPLPGPAEHLRALFADDPAFRHVAMACSDEPGQAVFHITQADDSSSLLPVADRLVAEAPVTRGVRTVTVEVTTLDAAVDVDELAPGPALLKIDTQGVEVGVLRGAERLLGGISHLIVEASFVELYQGQSHVADVIALLQERGFGLTSAYDVKTSRLTGEPLQADLLFSRRPLS